MTTLVSTKKKKKKKKIKTPKTSISKGKIRMKRDDRNIESGGRYVGRRRAKGKRRREKACDSVGEKRERERKGEGGEKTIGERRTERAEASARSFPFQSRRGG